MALNTKPSSKERSLPLATYTVHRFSNVYRSSLSPIPIPTPSL
jgi:hypothetical protein